TALVESAVLTSFEAELTRWAWASRRFSPTTAGDQDARVGYAERDEVGHRRLEPHERRGVAPNHDVELVDGKQHRSDDDGDRDRLAKVGRVEHDPDGLPPRRPLR